MKEKLEPATTKEYTPKNYVENKQYFTSTQEKFLKSEVMKMERDALEEENYTHVYSADFIKECNEKILDREKAFATSEKIKGLKSEVQENPTITKEYREISSYLETLFYNKLGGKNGWIPDALVWKTSKYDDYINGVDFIVETNDKEFALATDLTFSHTKNLESKLSRIKHSIKRGTVPEVTFYERVETKVAKPIPHVIIAVEHEKVIKALKLWADGQGDLLDNHSLKAKTLLEIEAQLEAFATYAKAIGKRNIASAYNDMLAKIQLLIINHEEVIKMYKEKIDNDLAYKTIQKFCEELEKEANEEEKSTEN